MRGIHRSPVNSPHKGQWRVTLMFSLICAWINGWVNNGEAGNMRRHRAHYDVIVMETTSTKPYLWMQVGVVRSTNACQLRSIITLSFNLNSQYRWQQLVPKLWRLFVLRYGIVCGRQITCLHKNSNQTSNCIPSSKVRTTRILLQINEGMVMYIIHENRALYVKSNRFGCW